VKATNNFATKKYSVDQDSFLNTAVDDALLARSLLRALPLLDEGMREQVITHARAVIDRHQPSWRADGYHMPKDTRIDFDGIVLPFNQQHALGLLLIDYSRATGSDEFRPRIKALRDLFKAETVMQNNVRLWHHWPQVFYKGWTKEQGLSTFTPARAAEIDTWFEDISHGEIVAVFDREAADFLNEAPLLDIEVLAARVRTGPFSFYRFLAGKDREQAPSLCWVPPGVFAETNTLAKTYAHWLPRPWVDFDNQDLIDSYARAAGRGKASGRITVSRFENGKFRPNLTLSATNGRCTLRRNGKISQDDCDELLSQLWR
jgi:hypothetical protein